MSLIKNAGIIYFIEEYQIFPHSSEKKKSLHWQLAIVKLGSAPHKA